MRSRIVQAMDIFADERHFRLRLFFEGIGIGCLTGGVIAVFRYLLEASEDGRGLAYAWLKEANPGWFRWPPACWPGSCAGNPCLLEAVSRRSRASCWARCI